MSMMKSMMGSMMMPIAARARRIVVRMALVASTTLALPALGTLASCGDGTRSDAGRDGALLIAEGTFFRCAMPGDDGGPNVAAVDLALTTLRAGVADSPLSGSLGPGSTAAAIGIVGDAGYFIVAAGVPAVASPDYPLFQAPISIASTTPAGVYQLVIRAVDGQGRFGPASITSFEVTRVTVQGALVITLTWDTEADVDLHVVDPSGSEIWARDINSWKPPPNGSPSDPDAWQQGGILDFDSNAGCAIDGRRQEDVVWRDAPPSGHYLVRVDTPSLCGEIGARWSVVAVLDGHVVGHSTGTSFDVDTRGAHDAGAGVLALQLDVP